METTLAPKVPQPVTTITRLAPTTVPLVPNAGNGGNLTNFQILVYCCTRLGRVTAMIRTMIPVPVKAQPSMPRLVNETTSAPATKSAIDTARPVHAILVIIMKSTIRSVEKLVEANTLIS